jgi:hypothetical protein
VVIALFLTIVTKRLDRSIGVFVMALNDGPVAMRTPYNGSIGKDDFRSWRVIVILVPDTIGANRSVVASILASRPITSIRVHLRESVDPMLCSRNSTGANSRGIATSQGGTADVRRCDGAVRALRVVVRKIKYGGIPAVK